VEHDDTAPVTDAPTDPSEGTVHLPAPGPWASYVAVGDSFTEGLWDAEPADPAQCRGWADLLARSLSHRRIDSGQDPLLYANLAIRGKQIRSILGDQLPVALEMKPDLVSLIGGGNDILRPSVDVDQVARSIEDAVVRIRETGADVLLGTGFDASDSPLVGMTRGRTGILNAHLWSIAQRHGAHVLDLWQRAQLRRHFRRLDAVAANLHLLVQAPEEQYPAQMIEAHPVTRAVPLLTEARLIGLAGAQVTARHGGTFDIQLAADASRQHSAIRPTHADTHVAQGPPERRIVLAVDLVGQHAHGGFAGPVMVDDAQVRAQGAHPCQQIGAQGFAT